MENGTSAMKSIGVADGAAEQRRRARDPNRDALSEAPSLLNASADPPIGTFAIRGQSVQRLSIDARRGLNMI